MSNDTLFDAVANRFTILEIAAKLVSVLPSYSMADVGAAFMEADDWENANPDQIMQMGLVQAGDIIFGKLYRFEDREYEKAEDVAEPLTLSEMVADSTSILEIIPLFEKHDIFFVLSRNEITHYVEFEHLDKLPAKLCLFSLFLELELEMIRVLTFASARIQNHLRHLPEKRLEKAKNLCKIKYKEETPKNLLLCTTFIDKKIMVQADSYLSQILPFPDVESQDKFFKTVEDLRNQIAHGDSILSVIKTSTYMNEFITKMRETLQALADTVSQ